MKQLKASFQNFPPKKKDVLGSLCYSFNCFDFIEKELETLKPKNRSGSLLNLAWRVQGNERLNDNEKTKVNKILKQHFNTQEEDVKETLLEYCPYLNK